MAKIIFKQVVSVRSEVTLALGSEVSQEEKSLLTAKKSLLDSIYLYMIDLKWLSHKTAKERVKTFIDLAFDYRRSAEKLGIESLSSFETSLWYAGKKFQKLIGETLIRDIAQADSFEKVEALSRQFAVKIGDFGLSSVLIEGAMGVLPSAKPEVHFKPSDCMQELRVLKNLTVRSIRNLLLTRGKEEKYSFIRYFIDSGDARYTDHREWVFKYLEGEISFEELQYRLENIESS